MPNQHLTYPPDLLRTLERAITLFIASVEEEENALWKQAEIAAQASRVYGHKTASIFAQQTGKSAGYIRSLIAAANAFPEERDRAPDMSMTHHRIAAMTTDPVYWINQAVINQWSTRQLQDSITEAQDPFAEAEGMKRAKTRLNGLVEEFNQRWGHQVHVDLLWSQSGDERHG